MLIRQLAWHIHALWSSPLSLIIAFAMTYNIIGLAMLPTLFCGILLVPINWLVSGVAACCPRVGSRTCELTHALSVRLRCRARLRASSARCRSR